MPETQLVIYIKRIAKCQHNFCALGIREAETLHFLYDGAWHSIKYANIAKDNTCEW